VSTFSVAFDPRYLLPISHEFISLWLTIKTGKNESKQEKGFFEEGKKHFAGGKFNWGGRCTADFCKVCMTVLTSSGSFPLQKQFKSVQKQ
jgi:hypothetical protein